MKDNRKQNETRSERVTIRLSESEKVLLQQKAAAANMELGSYVRNVALENEVVQNKEFSELAAELCRHHNLCLRVVPDILTQKCLFEWEEAAWRHLR